MLSLAADLLKCILYSQVGSPRDAHCCQIAPEAVSRAHRGPASHSLFLSVTCCCSLQMSTFACNKKVLLFHSKKKKKKRKCSATSHLWTHEKKLPPLLFVWLRATAGENRNKAAIAHDKFQAVKPLMKQLWIYATISHNCAEEFLTLLK